MGTHFIITQSVHFHPRGDQRFFALVRANIIFGNSHNSALRAGYTSALLFHLLSDYSETATNSRFTTARSSYPLDEHMGRIAAVIWISEARRRFYLAGVNQPSSGRLAKVTGSAVPFPRKRSDFSNNGRCGLWDSKPWSLQK